MKSPLIWKRRKSLGDKQHGNILEYLRLVLLQPEDFWRGEARHGANPRKLANAGDGFVEVCGLRHASARHSTGSPDAAPAPPRPAPRRHAFARKARWPLSAPRRPRCSDLQGPAGLLQAGPPLRGRLFGPLRPRPRDCQTHFGNPGNPLFMIGNYAFERGGPEIDAKIGCRS